MNLCARSGWRGCVRALLVPKCSRRLSMAWAMLGVLLLPAHGRLFDRAVRWRRAFLCCQPVCAVGLASPAVLLTL